VLSLTVAIGSSSSNLRRYAQGVDNSERVADSICAEVDEDKVLNAQHAIEEAMSTSLVYDHSLNTLTRTSSQSLGTRMSTV
jgi:hypothetical protein